MKSQILVGVDSCSKSSLVRFDEVRQRLASIFGVLSDYINLEPISPDALKSAAEEHRLCGYVICSDQPLVGVDEEACSKESDVPVWQKMPWLPVEDLGSLDDEARRENFTTRVFALFELNALWQKGLTRGELIAFYSRYKLLLLAHSQPGYRALGPFVASIGSWRDLRAFAEEYRHHLMALLRHRASRSNHTNVLMHVQGYFRPRLSSPQRQALADVIMRYRQGELPLAEPIAQMKSLMAEYPDAYLLQQRYFTSYSEEMSLRYSL